MKSFLVAMQFLTVFTLRSGLRFGAEDLARSRAWFGLVGGVMGLALALVAWLLGFLLPGLALAGLLVALWEGCSRFLHVDGLADTADGLIHTTSRERALAIMKDTHLGSFGLAAVVCVLLIKFGVLASLSTERLWPAFLVAAPLGRALAAALSGFLPAAKPGSGLGGMVSAGAPAQCLASMVTALVIAGLAGGLAGLAAALGVLLAGLVLGRWFMRRIGGVTGDTLGASIELGEVAALLVYAAVPSQSLLFPTLM